MLKTQVATLLISILALCSVSYGAGNSHGFPQPQKDSNKATKPAPIQILSPKAFEKVSAQKVELTWQETQGAQAYHLQVATDPEFKWVIINENFYEGLKFELSNLQAGTTYFWRVAGVKRDNDPTWMKGIFTLSSFETKK